MNHLFCLLFNIFRPFWCMLLILQRSRSNNCGAFLNLFPLVLSWRDIFLTTRTFSFSLFIWHCLYWLVDTTLHLSYHKKRRVFRLKGICPFSKQRKNTHKKEIVAVVVVKKWNMMCSFMSKSCQRVINDNDLFVLFKSFCHIFFWSQQFGHVFVEMSDKLWMNKSAMNDTACLLGFFNRINGTSNVMWLSSWSCHNIIHWDRYEFLQVH